MSQWPEFTENAQRVVDADPAPSPTYAQPTPTEATPQSHATQLGHKMARVGLTILLLLVGVVAWFLLALPAGIVGFLVAVVLMGALIAGTLYALRASFLWRW